MIHCNVTGCQRTMCLVLDQVVPLIRRTTSYTTTGQTKDSKEKTMKQMQKAE